jgi:putative oxidoreductase
MSPAKRRISFCLRLVLGGIFLYAGLGKISEPYAFAATIQAYQLLPQFLVGLSAVVIPWTESLSAIALILGRKPRSALLIFITLLIIFMVVIGLTMMRGLDIDCGCGLLANRRVGWLVLLEDGVLLLITTWLYTTLLPQFTTAIKS